MCIPLKQIEWMVARIEQNAVYAGWLVMAEY